jgi:hypothetical protein
MCVRLITVYHGGHRKHLHDLKSHSRGRGGYLWLFRS